MQGHWSGIVGYYQRAAVRAARRAWSTLTIVAIMAIAIASLPALASSTSAGADAKSSPLTSSDCDRPITTFPDWPTPTFPHWPVTTFNPLRIAHDDSGSDGDGAQTVGRQPCCPSPTTTTTTTSPLEHIFVIPSTTTTVAPTTTTTAPQPTPTLPPIHIVASAPAPPPTRTFVVVPFGEGSYALNAKLKAQVQQLAVEVKNDHYRAPTLSFDSPEKPI